MHVIYSLGIDRRHPKPPVDRQITLDPAVPKINHKEIKLINLSDAIVHAMPNATTRVRDDRRTGCTRC